MPSRSKDYRQFLYTKYVTGKSRRNNDTNDRTNHMEWMRAAAGRFKGWLPLDAQAAILDAGCGQGNFLFMLEKLGYVNLVGVDWSREQLAQAARVCRNSRLVQDDFIHYLRESDEKFDLIVSLNVIEHLDREEILDYLNLIRDHLHPGGRLLIETPNAASPWFGTVAYGDLTHEWFFTPGSLADTLLLAGFNHFEARSTMHFSPLDTRNLLRLAAWRVIRTMLAVWNIVETGGNAGGIYTRVFVATAIKA